MNKLVWRQNQGEYSVNLESGEKVEHWGESEEVFLKCYMSKVTVWHKGLKAQR